MATKYIDILNLAYGRNKKNTKNVIVAEATEGLRVAYRAVRGVYAAAARINPTYFGLISAPVAFVDPGWLRPADAELVYRIERASDAARVWLSPLNDRLLNADKPAVYRWGKVYRPVGGALGPDNAASLRFFYSLIPAAPATVDDNLPASWDEAYNELLGLEVAIYMSIKDERAEEIAMLKGERDPWAQQYVAHLEHETIGETREFIDDFNTAALFPIGSLFAGGAQLQGK